MNEKEIINENLKSTQATKSPGVWVNGEMKSMLAPFAMVGFVIGLLVGVCASIYLNAYYEIYKEFEFTLFLIPFFTGFFGAAAGAAIGIGTPRRNRHPEQGWAVSFPRFIFRNKLQKRVN